ncbi:MAG TPA: hypothetical protein VIF57_11955 [Polyangia bacterium]
MVLGGLLTLLLQKSFIVQSDEGYTLNAAWQVWNGLRMYDDFRLFVGPGAGYAVLLAWKVAGGPSFLAARVLSLLLSFSSIAAVHLILARRGVRGAALALAVVAWVIASAQYVLLNHNALSSYAAAWMLLALLRTQDRERDGGRARLVDHALVGVAGGAVLLFVQTKGLVLIGAAAAFTLLAGGGRRGLRAAAALLAGALLIVAPLLLAWRPSVLVREWFVVPLTGGYLGHTGASPALAIACGLVAAGMAAVAWRLRDRRLGAIAVVQAALVVGMLHNAEPHHVAVNAFPLIVFVPLLLQRRAAARPAPAAPPKVPPASLVMAIVVGMFAVLLATPIGRPIWRASTLYVDFIRRAPRNIFPQPRVAAARAIYAGPFLPGLYFALGKPNPYFVSETVVCNADCHARLLAQIEAIKPEIAFLDYEMVRHLGYDANNAVDDYFRDRYVACRQDDYEGLLVRAIDPSWCP